ncbi:MAG: hypothetical protein AVDCRST_MAG04-1389, partial [uncultured Acetobacteraceae bacterium]
WRFSYWDALLLARPRRPAARRRSRKTWRTAPPWARSASCRPSRGTASTPSRGHSC